VTLSRKWQIPWFYFSWHFRRLTLNKKSKNYELNFAQCILIGLLPMAFRLLSSRHLSIMLRVLSRAPWPSVDVAVWSSFKNDRKIMNHVSADSKLPVPPRRIVIYGLESCPPSPGCSTKNIPRSGASRLTKGNWHRFAQTNIIIGEDFRHYPGLHTFKYCALLSNMCSSNIERLRLSQPLEDSENAFLTFSHKIEMMLKYSFLSQLDS